MVPVFPPEHIHPSQVFGGAIGFHLRAGENDSEEEIRELARWLASISPEISLHLSRFFPQYQMVDRLPMPVEQVYRLAEAARGYLSYVYTGNC